MAASRADRWLAAPAGSHAAGTDQKPAQTSIEVPALFQLSIQKERDKQLNKKNKKT